MIKDVEKKDLVVVGLCFLFMIWWAFFQVAPPPPPPVPPGPVAHPNGPTPLPGPGVQPPAAGEEMGPPKSLAPDPPPVSLPPAVTAEYANLLPAVPVTLKTGTVAEVTVDPTLGGITGVVLHSFAGANPQQQVEVGEKLHPVTALAAADGQPLAFSPAKVVAEPEAGRVTVSRLLTGTPLLVQQTWEAVPDEPYHVRCRLTFRNLGEQPWDVAPLLLGAGSMRQLGPPPSFWSATGRDLAADVRYVGDPVCTAVDPTQVQKAAANPGKDPPAWTTREAAWLALENKYFATILMPKTPLKGVRLTTERIDPNQADSWSRMVGQLVLPARPLAAQEARTLEFDCFLGPKHYDTLKTFGAGTEQTLQLGLFLWWHPRWMEWISLAFLRSLNLLHAVLRNYGVAIILITIVLRAGLSPLVHFSTKVSRGMQKIQPLIKELREKYKDDPQKMQQKMMELYREHKINPMTGCLPVVVQIPVFFALFNVLRSAIELRQAGFLWVADLSQADAIFGIPLHPLALCMGGTMYLQMKMVPVSADPMQQKMMQYMSLFFIVLLYSMPSGLTLYWTINNLCSIIQYRVTNHLLGEVTPALPARAKT